MKRATHLLIATVFGVACFLLWALITFVSLQTQQRLVDPATFFKMCVRFKDGLLLLPLPAIAYGVHCRRDQTGSNKEWRGFLAIIFLVLALATVVILAASWLPRLQLMDKTRGR